MAMPGFGYGVGDFIGVEKLVTRILQSLSDSRDASEDCRSLISSLKSLEASIKIARTTFDVAYGARATANAIKYELDACEKLIKKFYLDSKHYAELLCNGKNQSLMLHELRKVSWTMFKTGDIQRLQRDLSVHLQALNVLVGSLTCEIILGFSRSNPSTFLVPRTDTKSSANSEHIYQDFDSLVLPVSNSFQSSAKYSEESFSKPSGSDTSPASSGFIQPDLMLNGVESSKYTGKYVSKEIIFGCNEKFLIDPTIARLKCELELERMKRNLEASITHEAEQIFEERIRYARLMEMGKAKQEAEFASRKEIDVMSKQTQREQDKEQVRFKPEKALGAEKEEREATMETAENEREEFDRRIREQSWRGYMGSLLWGKS